MELLFFKGIPFWEKNSGLLIFRVDFIQCPDFFVLLRFELNRLTIQ